MIREGKALTRGQRIWLTVLLSMPAILAQLSSIVMQYIDAAMVGSLGAEPAAAIGLVSTTTWLFSGLCSAATTGFSVQVAHLIGGGNMAGARRLLRQAFTAVLVFGMTMALIGTGISGALPALLGGDESIRPDASRYFLIFSAFLPMLEVYCLAGGMLRCSGNMKVPSMIGILMCAFDVIFNYFFIFPTRHTEISGIDITMPGLGLGVEGAALGTAAAETLAGLILAVYLFTSSRDLKAREGEKYPLIPEWRILAKAFRIGAPMGIQHAIICIAQILTTVIVAPLGIFAIAANSFGITAEALCYMPGYGIAEAATTLVGQSIGAKRKELTRSFAYICVAMGMAAMGVMGVAMYVFAPEIFSMLTPVEEIRNLGVEALRIEAFAEPMFAAAIVAYGALVGTGDTLIPCGINVLSIWIVRLSLAAILAPVMGLNGVWLAMCIELCVRGTAFLIYTHRKFRITALNK